MAESTSDESALDPNIEIDKETNQNYKCDLCPKVLSNPERLKRHVKSVHDQIKDHQCEQCNTSYSDSQSLRRHVRTKHENGNEANCDLCGKGFPENYAMLRHKKTVHFKTRLVDCDLCSKTFSEPYTLKRHLKTVHKVIQDNRALSNMIENQMRISNSERREETPDFIEQPLVENEDIIQNNEETKDDGENDQEKLETSDDENSDEKIDHTLKNANENATNLKPPNDDDLIFKRKPGPASKTETRGFFVRQLLEPKSDEEAIQIFDNKPDSRKKSNAVIENHKCNHCEQSFKQVFQLKNSQIEFVYAHQYVKF